MFRQKNLDSILSGFNKVIADLKDLIEHHDNGLTDKRQQISSLGIEIDNHHAEKTQALSVLNNLENLVKGN